jgi:hypothetical protein
MSFEVKFKFATEEAARHFMSHMCDGCGEQDYWQYMEHREKELPGNITAVDFKYNFDTMIIETTLGRLDE